MVNSTNDKYLFPHKVVGCCSSSRKLTDMINSFFGEYYFEAVGAGLKAGIKRSIKVSYMLTRHSKRAAQLAKKLITNMAKIWLYIPVISTTTKVAVRGA